MARGSGTQQPSLDHLLPRVSPPGIRIDTELGFQEDPLVFPPSFVEPAVAAASVSALLRPQPIVRSSLQVEQDPSHHAPSLSPIHLRVAYAA